MYFLLFLSHVLPMFQPSPYAKAFGDSYHRAEEILANNLTQFQVFEHSCNCNTSEIMAIVFPELLRYNDLNNLFETSALELLYAEGGISEVDFSIGAAQIKPSFAERMEQVNTDYSLIPKFSGDHTEARRERLQRLENIQWQFRYVCAFSHYMYSRFPNINSLSDKERVMFLAAAYNLGPDADETDIVKWQYIKAFPYGKKYLGTQYSYAAIAADHYLRNQKPLP
jgi:hypothetical protein